MYSRSRLPPSEERYKSSVPPLYSGNRFQNVRRERTAPVIVQQEPPQPESAMPERIVESESEERELPAEPDEAVTSETAVPPAAENASGIFGLSREDLLLLGLLLLLSAEHEHSMDVIVILLLLLGIR